MSLLWDTLAEHSGLTLPKRAFRTRLPPKVTCQSLQNGHFVRDVLQKSSGKAHRSTHIKQPCQAVSRLQPFQATPAHTPIPMSQRHSPSTTTRNLTVPCAYHENLLVHTSNTHKVLRLPRHLTSAKTRNLTIPCACHGARTSTRQSPHKLLRLPRKVTISYHVSFNQICTTPHLWSDFGTF